MAHTPKPWIDKRGKTGLIRGIYTATGTAIVRWHGLGQPQSEEGQSNAMLMVAAPDLLEALEGLMDAAEFANENNSPFGCYSEEIKAAKAAISKAKGDAK